MSDAPLQSSKVPTDGATLAVLPERIQLMLALLLAHQDVLCTYPTGALELHFHAQSVKAKIVCNPG
jgi:hypothetical protein